jgi:HD-GYP domain-containing protein (c-di-GMP phosphodiesterase class II)
MTRGEIPNIIRDVRNDERTTQLDVARKANIGAYVGVPIQLSDGRLYGTMCCVSHVAEPSLRERDIQFMHLLAQLVGNQIEREALQSQNWRLQVESAGAGALMAALDERDGYTGEHSAFVVELAGKVARSLELSEQEIKDVKQVALLHDIGKIGVPDAVLNKPGPLDRDEWQLMQEHTVIGERIIRSIDGLAHLAPGIRNEHERWDGTGYPDQLRGEKIPLSSRVILVCDAYHAMISDRPYRAAIDPALAVAEISRNSGTQFDPRIVDALITCLETSYAALR